MHFSQAIKLHIQLFCVQLSFNPGEGGFLYMSYTTGTAIYKNRGNAPHHRAFLSTFYPLFYFSMNGKNGNSEVSLLCEEFFVC